MKRVRVDRLVRARGLISGMSRRRQVRFRQVEIRNAGAIIYSGVVILDAPGNGGSELLPVGTGRDALSLRRIADEPRFEQDGWDLDVPQDVEARVAHAAI